MTGKSFSINPTRTEGQLKLLAANGCDEMQGNYFSKPMDAHACARLLHENKSLALDKLLRHPYERTLLVVDDELRMIAAFKRTMRNKGYKVLTTTSASEAFEILATTDVGVILCDQRMPCISGEIPMLILN